MSWSLGRFAPCLILLTLAVCATSGVAQESRWKELNEQIQLLNKQEKYAAALPVATEQVKVAEATFGPSDIRVAMSLSNLAQLNSLQGKKPEAEPLYLRALHIQEAISGPDDPDLAFTLNNLAGLYEDLVRYAEAEPLYLRALKIAEKALGADSPTVAAYFNNLAFLYVDEARYADAELLYLRSLSIDESKLGPDDPEVANTLDNLGSLYVDAGKYDQAEPRFQRALRIREKALSPDDPDVIQTLNNLAGLYAAQGKYAQAEPLYKRAIQINEKTPGSDRAGQSKEIGNLADLYFHEGRYSEAETLFRRSVDIAEKTLAPDQPERAIAINNLGVFLDAIGKKSEAESLYRQALNAHEKALGPNHPSVAIDLGNLGGLYDGQGKFAEADPLFQRSLHILEKSKGPDHPEVAAQLRSLALLYDHQGKYSESEALYQRALQIDEKSLGPNHPFVASDLNGLGLLDDHEGKYADALPLLKRAVAIREQTLGIDSPDLAINLSNLALLYDDEGNYAEAVPLIQRALRIFEKTFGPEDPHVAIGLSNLASNFKDQGKFADAEVLFNRALKIQEKTQSPDHPEIATTLTDLADLYDDEGKYHEAQPIFQRAFDNLFQQFQYSSTYMTEKERLGFLDTVAEIFPGYFSFVHRFHGKDPQLIGSMYDLLLWEKGFIAGSVADMRRRVEASGDVDALKLLAQLTAKRQEIAALLNAEPSDRTLWRQQIDQLRSESDVIEKALVARSSTFAEHKKLDKATWQQVRDALKPREAAIEFAHFRFYDKEWTDESYYVALVVTAETKDHPAYIVLGENKQIEGEAFTKFQHSVQTRGFEAEESAQIPGAEAYAPIWQPLENALAGKTRIYISPDGILNELPLGIIQSPDGILLMERYDLRLVSSTRDILRTAPPSAAKTVLLIGDPLFNLTADRQLAATNRIAQSQPTAQPLALALLKDDQSRDLAKGSELPPLPGTGAEVAAIAGLMQDAGWKTNLFTQDMALKSVVEQALNPRVVHLATHGFFLPDQEIDPNNATRDRTRRFGAVDPARADPMLRSGLFFAGANRTLAGKPSPDGIDNGVLTALEAGNLNLTGTELIVLSACNTGQGELKNGEGVFGLRRALQEAGAQSVLMSLWSVPDKETLQLMQLFYAKWLSGVEKHEALKQAQLEVRAAVKLSHNGRDLPYYWGAFVLVGQ